jgi:hypothetical protein
MIITTHARKQMSVRKITEIEVATAVKYGRVVKTNKSETTGNPVVVKEYLIRGCRLHVVVVEGNVVMTVVYKTPSGSWEPPTRR